MKFIAEVSSNHHRDLDRAIAFIKSASAIGCQAVKFQLFKIDELFAPEILAKSPMHRARRDWELPLDFLPVLSEQCRINNIEFSCTPFYLEAVEELFPYVDFYKIASYELLWDQLLAECARTSKPVIISTGMATVSEIQHAVHVLRENGCLNPTLLHCTSSYPTPYTDANLSAIQTIREDTGCKLGWSDHTVEPSVIHRAIHRWGAEVIEFHLDIDSKGDEYSAGHCWLPNQISQVISDVNKAILSDGDGIKQPVASEIADRVWRADPSDGLRPLKELRASWSPKQ